MKRTVLLIGFALMVFVNQAMAQNRDEFKPSGKVTGKVFGNYLFDMTKDIEKKSAFEINRAYLGYKYKFNNSFSASVTLDVGANDGGSSYTAYLKKAQLDWNVSSVFKVSMGMLGLEQFSDQEKFWGYRYMQKSFQDQYGFGASADLGVKANVNIVDGLSANVFVINGEGYKKIQDEDGRQKIGADLVLKTQKGLIAKVYYDINSAKVQMDGGAEKDVTVSAFATFLGYKISDHFRLGAEYNVLFNGPKDSKVADDHNLNGFSFYSTYSFNKKVEVFGRYDVLSSNKLEGEIEKWNLSNNGSGITTGIQYAPVKGVKMALNYKGFMYKDDSKNDKSQLFLNLEFKF